MNNQTEMICQECGAEIESLNYEAEAIEWGDADLYGGDFNYSDHERNNEVRFTCPECDNSIDPLPTEVTPREPSPPKSLKDINKLMK